MIFHATPLAGAYTIELDKRGDDRGFFARCFAEEEFAALGLVARFPHANLSRNTLQGTLRGMHYAVAPSLEAKVVRCVSGAIYDVIVDLRPASPTYCHHVGVMLSAENRRMLYIPEQFAHGFLTLEDNSEVSYHMSEFYAPTSARGFRWDDASFRLEWPEAITVISEKDRAWPAFLPERGTRP